VPWAKSNEELARQQRIIRQRVERAIDDGIEASQTGEIYVMLENDGLALVTNLAIIAQG
jgi:hypothetical protein